MRAVRAHTRCSVSLLGWGYSYWSRSRVCLLVSAMHFVNLLILQKNLNASQLILDKDATWQDIKKSQAHLYTAEPPTRDEDGFVIFVDAPEFRPNLTPAEVNNTHAHSSLSLSHTHTDTTAAPPHALHGLLFDLSNANESA